MSSLPLLDDALWGLVCLGLPPAGVTSAGVFHCALAGAHRCSRCCGRGSPPAPLWLAGSPVPCFASAARSARTAQRRGRLRLSGVALRAACFSATAVWLLWRAVATLFGMLRASALVAVVRSSSLVAPLSSWPQIALLFWFLASSVPTKVAHSAPHPGGNHFGDWLPLPRITSAAASHVGFLRRPHATLPLRRCAFAPAKRLRCRSACAARWLRFCHPPAVLPLPPPTPCAASAPSLLSSLVRARLSRLTATALPVVVGLGSPSARRAPLGHLTLSPPATAQRHARRTHPATNDGGVSCSLRSRARPVAPTPSALKGTNLLTMIIEPADIPGSQ